MITDITIGQFFPGRSILHRTDPRVKICLTLLSIVLLFTAGNFYTLAVIVAFLTGAMLLSLVPIKLYVQSLKPVMLIMIFMAVLNLFYGTGTPIWTFGFLKITMNGIYRTIFVAVQIFFLILTSCVLTFTTSPTQLTDAIERLLAPLAKVKVPVHEFAMTMTIALRFIPILLEETEKIMSAQKARGADMESGGLIQRVKALIPVLIPLFVSAFRRSFDLATAMESRCYHGGAGRTKLKVLKMSKTDGFVFAATALMLALFIALSLLFPGRVYR